MSKTRKEIDKTRKEHDQELDDLLGICIWRIYGDAGKMNGDAGGEMTIYVIAPELEGMPDPHVAIRRATRGRWGWSIDPEIIEKVVMLPTAWRSDDDKTLEGLMKLISDRCGEFIACA